MYKTQLDSNMITEEEYRKKVERLNEIYGIRNYNKGYN